MDKYRVKIKLPTLMETTVQEVQGVAAVVGITDQHLIAEVECDDRYDLGVILTQLEHTLQSIWTEGMPISKPVLSGPTP